MALCADVFKVILLDGNNNAVADTTLQDANIEISTTANDVRAGQGNELIAIIHSTRDINISLTEVNWKLEHLAMNLGQTITTAAGVAYAMPKLYTAVDNTGSIEITLDNAPRLDGGVPELLKIYDVSGQEISDFTVSDNIVTFSTGVNDGDKVEVRTYTYDSDANTEQLVIDNTVFPSDWKVVLETIEIDDDEQPVAYLQYQFDRAKPSGNITINTTSERNASTQELSLRVLKPKTSTVIGRVLRIPISA